MAKKRLSRNILKIVLLSMGAVFIFQIFIIAMIMRDSNLRRQEATEAAALSVATSLDVIGQNLAGLGQYLSNFEAFQQLFLAERGLADNPAVFVSTAFHTIRYMTDHFPMILDVIVVPTTGIPFTFYTGHGYEMLEIISQVYDFSDPTIIESRFLYFEALDYFVYVTPISRFVTPDIVTEKFATCIIIGDKNFIAAMIEGETPYGFLRYGVFDETGRLIASNVTLYDYEEYLLSLEVYSMGLTVRAFDDLHWAADASVTMFIFFIVFSLLILAAMVALLIILLNRMITRPISNIAQEMSAWEGLPLKNRLQRSQIYEIDQLLAGFNSMLNEIEIGTRKIFITQEKLYELEIHKTETEIYALQSQINPHFLFNTLQCIRALAIVEKVDNIAQVTLSMSEMLRYAMHYQEVVTIREEIEIIRHYIFICDIRFSGKFRFNIDCDPQALDNKIGRMTLQPLVENAVMHGVSKLESDGIVNISGGVDADKVWIKVEDNGPGIDKERLAQIEAELMTGFAETLASGKGSSFGLYNINRRLKLLYGDDFGLNIQSGDGITSVHIHVPSYS